MSIVIFIIILLVLVLVHEFGHFFTAKLFGMRVDEFGFGFPPRLFGFKKGETEYTFNLFPIGGFVKIFGESPDDESMSGPDSARALIGKAKWKQAIVLVAGVVMNFLLAWLLFSIGLMSGVPTSVGSNLPGYELDDVNLLIVSVLPDSPAAKAGLKLGDAIVSVSSLSTDIGENNENLEDITPESVKAFVGAHSDKEIEIGFTRGRSQDVKFTDMTPAPGVVDHKPMIGISMDQIGTAKLPFFVALKEGLLLTLSVIKDTAVGLYTLIAEAIMGHGSLAGITGPVGMVGIVGDAYDFGFAYLLSFAALISVNLGIINLIPFPALDGGRLFFLLIEKIKGSAINPKFANMANTIGFGILILLMVLVTYHDIVRLI
ncbi:MAG: site-2 protease family protein [Patescibacteria group bacterium]